MSYRDFLPEATNFQDIPKMEKPQDYPSVSHECPKCKGHGKWNLTVDAYGPGTHFQQCCGQCNGWGWVAEADLTCMHEYAEISQAQCKKRGIQHWGSCWHVYACTKCDRITAHDSSD